MDYFKIISESSIAEGLTAEETRKLTDIAEPLQFFAGDIMIKDQDSSYDIFIVYEGKVSVEIKRFPYDSTAQPLQLLKTGGVIGEFAFIDRSPRSANVMAHENVKCLRLPGEALENLIKNDYKIGYLIINNIARILTSRIRNTNLELRNQLVW